MKKILLLFIPLILAFFLVSCEDSTTDPPVVGKGSISLSSTPSGATILVNSNPTTKTTPAIITDLDAGTVTVTLKLTDYRDTTFTMDVTADMQTTKHVILSQNAPELQAYSGIKMYERASNNLSGLDLSTGTRTGSGAAETDIYYEGLSINVQILRSQHLRNPLPVTLRYTYFYTTTDSDLEDGNDSPLYTSGGSLDTETNSTTDYSFLYDSDSHYSKLIITGTGQDGPFDHWITVDYVYNKKINDVRF